VFLDQQETKQVNLVCDLGTDFIWRLEDAYEQKDMDKFFSLVSLDFKKDFLKLMNKFKLMTLYSESRKLYIHFIGKNVDPAYGIYSYDICWINRLQERESKNYYRELGKATIVLKICEDKQSAHLKLYDIYGESPFN